jgi:hypothetical protein
VILALRLPVDQLEMKMSVLCMIKPSPRPSHASTWATFRTKYANDDTLADHYCLILDTLRLFVGSAGRTTHQQRDAARKMDIAA